VRTDLINSLGSPFFLPNIIGWASALSSIVLMMVIWYLLCAWNEQRYSTGVVKF
jgi:hypothetical protein